PSPKRWNPSVQNMSQKHVTLSCYQLLAVGVSRIKKRTGTAALSRFSGPHIVSKKKFLEEKERSAPSPVATTAPSLAPLPDPKTRVMRSLRRCSWLPPELSCPPAAAAAAASPSPPAAPSPSADAGAECCRTPTSPIRRSWKLPEQTDVATSSATRSRSPVAGLRQPVAAGGTPSRGPPELPSSAPNSSHCRNSPPLI
ncbi:unnamed protein product, partial [Urochloa humidicola]